MRILHNHTFIYIVQTIGKRESLVPTFLKSIICKKITFFHERKKDFLQTPFV